MGYWNGWENYEEWYMVSHTEGKICEHCGSEFWPKSGRSKYCSRDQNPACDDDRYFEKLWQKNKHPLQLTGIIELMPHKQTQQ